jgi:predicted dehydrogenase
MSAGGSTTGGFCCARRSFLKRASLGAAALSLSPLVLRGAPGANDRLRIGMIGNGDRAQTLLAEIIKVARTENAQVTAICDVWKKNRESTAAKIQKEFSAEPRQFSKFEELLALKDVDAVTIATPDFGHTPILLAALKAGKDVYVEKPMSLDLDAANRALDLARLKKAVVQVGTQRRSEGKCIAAAKEIASGVLGKISRVSVGMHFNHARWARPYDDCKEADVDWPAFLLGKGLRPFDAKLLRRWQLYRFCTNGIAGLWLPHYADLVCMLTGAKYPTRGVSLGGNFVWKDDREHSDTFHTILEYPEGFLFDFAMSLGNAGGTHCTIHGTAATLDVEAATITPEGGTKDKPVEAKRISAAPETSHMANWLQCIRSRELPVADIQFGQQHTVAVVMSALAFETGLRHRYEAVRRTVSPG